MAMNCTIYIVNCNYVTHATCPLTLMVEKYSELQMSGATQKLSWKANCKTPFFLIVEEKNYMCNCFGIVLFSIYWHTYIETLKSIKKPKNTLKVVVTIFFKQFLNMKTTITTF
jgi:hypothetical protein